MSSRVLPAEIFRKRLPESGDVPSGGPLHARHDVDVCPGRPGSPVQLAVPVAPRALG